MASKIKELTTALLLIACVLLPQSVFATVTTIDAFNSDTKSTGDLTGQDGWSGSANYDVENTVYYEGNQAVTHSGAGGEIGLGVTGQTTGIFGAWIQFTNTGSSVYFDLSEGATDRTLLQEYSGSVYFNGVTIIGTCTINVWCHLELKINQATGQSWGRINGGSWSDPKTVFNGGSFTVIDTVNLKQGDTDAAMYWDLITYDDNLVASAIPTPQQLIIFD